MPAHVVFAANDLYVPHMATAIASLVANNPGADFRLHVLCTGIADANWNRLMAGHDIPTVRHLLPAAMFEALPSIGHIARSAYYRLFAADMIDAPRALYLDSDLIVLGSLAPLLQMDLQGMAVAAVEDPDVVPLPALGISKGARYFNSGVMLLDLDRWRATDMRSRVIERIRRVPEAIRYADQCGLNAVLDGAFKPLDPRFNMMTGLLSMKPDEARRIYGPEGVAPALADPAVVHFTGSLKPWRLNTRHPHKQAYWHYRNTTAFKSRVADDLGPASLLRWLVPEPMARGLRRLRG